MHTNRVTELAAEVIELPLLRLLVRVKSAAWESSAPGEGDLEVGAALSLAVQWHRSDAELVECDLYSTYTITAEASARGDESEEADAHASEEPEFGWKCKVGMHGRWSWDDAADLTEDHLRAFAVRVGLMTLHPYARAQIQSLVTNGGWPAYTLDVLTGQDQIFASEQDPSELDIDDGIEVEFV